MQIDIVKNTTRPKLSCRTVFLSDLHLGTPDSKAIKAKVKSAVCFVDRYEELLQQLAHHRHCHGIICGHIHTPEDKRVGEIHYLNSGDWVESLTAIIEHHDGRLELVRFQDPPWTQPATPTKPNSAPQPNAAPDPNTAPDPNPGPKASATLEATTTLRPNAPAQ